MNWPTAVSSVLIGLGAALMLVNIFSHRQTIRLFKKVQENQSHEIEGLISVHWFMMVFFFLGYVGILFLFINQIQILSEPLVAIIFFMGAVFVFLSIVIQKQMFIDLSTHNKRLKEENTLLKLEKHELIDCNNQLKDRLVPKKETREKGE